jgi:hypothetical protein
MIVLVVMLVRSDSRITLLVRVDRFSRRLEKRELGDVQVDYFRFPRDPGVIPRHT